MKPDQISKTAAFIAIKFNGLTQNPSFKSLFDDDVITFYDRIVQDLPAPLNYYHYWLKHDWIRRLYIWSEELLLPGDLLHVMARKLYIRQLVNQLLDDGYEQMLVLGAGFDDLALTYQQKEISCFELDVPLMVQFKQTFFDKWYPHQEHPAVASTYISDDNPMLELTKHAALDAQKKTIIIAEGFFDYLTTKSVNKILHELKTYFVSDPALITTHFALDELPIHQQWVFKTGVRTVGEQLQLQNTVDEFKDLLKETGFVIKKEFPYQSITKQLQKKTGSNLSILKGFYLLLAR